MNDVISCFNSRQWKCDELPDQINIESFLGCNLRCSMCPVPTARKSMNGRKPRAMSMETYRLIIDQVSDKTRTVNLTQLGEPLLNPHIAEFIKYGSDKGHCMGMTTNGTLLTRELGARLMDNGLAWITFSFDGATKETYESIRKGATFEKTLSNIHDFLDMKKSMGAHARSTYTAYCPMLPYRNSIPMTELWAEKKTSFSILSPWTTGAASFLCHESMAQNGRPRRRNVNQTTGIRVIFSTPSLPYRPKDRSCTAATITSCSLDCRRFIRSL